jgi:translation elongation factor EF-Tu-like GTPase
MNIDKIVEELKKLEKVQGGFTEEEIRNIVRDEVRSMLSEFVGQSQSESVKRESATNQVTSRQNAAANGNKHDLSKEAKKLMAACQIFRKKPDLRENPSYQDLAKRTDLHSYEISGGYKELENKDWIERGEKKPRSPRNIIFKKKLDNPEEYIESSRF